MKAQLELKCYHNLSTRWCVPNIEEGPLEVGQSLEIYEMLKDFSQFETSLFIFTKKSWLFVSYDLKY